MEILTMINISWASFLGCYAAFTILWYLTVGWMHFKKEIFAFALRKGNGVSLLPKKQNDSLHAAAVRASDQLQEMIGILRQQKRTKEEIVLLIKDFINGCGIPKGHALQSKLQSSVRHYMLSICNADLTDQELRQIFND